MLAVGHYLQEFFCATWSSRRTLNRDELTRALNHRSHRQWMSRHLDRKSKLAQLNLLDLLSLLIDWCENHINFSTR